MGEASLQLRGRFEFQERAFLWEHVTWGNFLMGCPFSLSCYSPAPLGLRIGARAEATQVQLNADSTLLIELSVAPSGIRISMTFAPQLPSCDLRPLTHSIIQSFKHLVGQPSLGHGLRFLSARFGTQATGSTSSGLDVVLRPSPPWPLPCLP